MNWGTKIVLGMSVFIIFILSMGVKMLMSNENDDLVEKDYYEKGLSYSEEYDKKVNAARDAVIPTIRADEQGLSVTFVGSSAYLIECKYVANSELDRTFKGKTTDNNVVLIPKEHLKEGAWRVNIEFSSNAKDYQYKQEISMP